MNGSNAERLKTTPNKLQSIQEMKEKIRRMKENPARRRIDEAGERYIKCRQTSQVSHIAEPSFPIYFSDVPEEIQITDCSSLKLIANGAGSINQKK